MEDNERGKTRGKKRRSKERTKGRVREARWKRREIE